MGAISRYACIEQGIQTAAARMVDQDRIWSAFSNARIRFAPSRVALFVGHDHFRTRRLPLQQIQHHLVVYRGIGFKGLV